MVLSTNDECLDLSEAGWPYKVRLQLSLRQALTSSCFILSRPAVPKTLAPGWMVLGWLKCITFIVHLFLLLSPGASLVTQRVQNLPAMQETGVWSLDQEDPLEMEMATHSSILA